MRLVLWIFRAGWFLSEAVGGGEGYLARECVRRGSRLRVYAVVVGLWCLGEFESAFRVDALFCDF